MVAGTLAEVQVYENEEKANGACAARRGPSIPASTSANAGTQVAEDDMTHSSCDILISTPGCSHTAVLFFGLRVYSQYTSHWT